MTINYLSTKDGCQNLNKILECVFRRVILGNNIIEKIRNIANDRSQPTPITRSRSKYFRMYSFQITNVVTDQELINIIDCKAKAALFNPNWTIIHVHNIKVGIIIALPDNTTDKK